MREGGGDVWGVQLDEGWLGGVYVEVWDGWWCWWLRWNMLWKGVRFVLYLRRDYRVGRRGLSSVGMRRLEVS